MQDHDNDRTKSYDGGHQEPTGLVNVETTTRRARRIAQRLAILEDSSLPRGLRERAQQRMRELEREGNEE